MTRLDTWRFEEDPDPTITEHLTDEHGWSDLDAINYEAKQGLDSPSSFS